ncbi:RmlC-like cupin [Stipitochalara longipes BDJ]|nr:RmlC-like cupin [Stipitochalara longipes BDJ]
MFKTLLPLTLGAFLISSTRASPLNALPSSSTSTNPFPASTPFTASQAEIKAIQEALILAPSEIDRENVLFFNPPDATNITFQFVNVTHKAPTGGEIVLNTVDNFPALIGTHVSAAIGFVDACGLNVPHSHPRANEFLTVVNGTLIGGLMLEEIPDANGTVNSGPGSTIPIPMVTATLTNFTGMLFPQGQVHFQFNPTCEPAVFAAAFDSNDSGRTQIANTFFSIGFDDVLETATGNSESLGVGQLDALRGHIPDSFALLMDDCAKTCGFATS